MNTRPVQKQKALSSDRFHTAWTRKNSAAAARRTGEKISVCRRRTWKKHTHTYRRKNRNENGKKFPTNCKQRSHGIVERWSELYAMLQFPGHYMHLILTHTHTHTHDRVICSRRLLNYTIKSFLPVGFFRICVFLFHSLFAGWYFLRSALIALCRTHSLLLCAARVCGFIRTLLTICIPIIRSSSTILLGYWQRSL